MAQDVVYRQALTEIVNKIPRGFDSVDGFKKVAGVLLAYDQISGNLGRKYLKEQQDNARYNVEGYRTTEKILKDVIDGSNLESLMKAEEDKIWTPEYVRHYNFSFSNLHRQVLGQLQDLGRAMYSNIHIAFDTTLEYAKMKQIASDCYNSHQEKFELWKKIADIKLEEITQATPLEIANAIYDVVKQQPGRENAMRGARALMYIHRKYPTEEIAKFIEGYANDFIKTPPPARRRLIPRLNKVLQEALTQIRASPQPNLS